MLNNKPNKLMYK